MSDMTNEFERVESNEILPANLGSLTGQEAVPVLERASLRLEILRGATDEFMQGVRENLEGAAA